MPIPIVQSQSQFENVRNGHTHTAIRRLFAPKSTRPRIQRDTHSAMAATHSSVSSERRGTHSSDVFTPSVRRSGRGGVVDIGQSTRTTVTRRCGTHSSASFMRPSGVRHLGAMREDGSAPLTWVLMGHGHPRISLCHPLCGMACGVHGGMPPTPQNHDSTSPPDDDNGRAPTPQTRHSSPSPPDRADRDVAHFMALGVFWLMDTRRLHYMQESAHPLLDVRCRLLYILEEAQVHLSTPTLRITRDAMRLRS